MKRKFIAIGIAMAIFLSGCGYDVGDVFYEGKYIKLVVIEADKNMSHEDYILEDAYTGDLYYYGDYDYGSMMTRIDRTLDDCE